VLLEASDTESGVIREKLQCYADARQILRVRGIGTQYALQGVDFGQTSWDFDGQEIFKKAVRGMSEASIEVLTGAGVSIDDVALIVPHQANLRIIESVAKYAGAPMEKVHLTVHKYGNMSSATAPVALVEAVEEGRVKPQDLILMPAFGGGLTLSAHLLRWGDRVTPLGVSDAELPPCEKTALELVNEIRALKERGAATAGVLANSSFSEQRG
jgi:3-oxoacyl-[acyl-carrier-protein] synthase-3